MKFKANFGQTGYKQISSGRARFISLCTLQIIHSKPVGYEERRILGNSGGRLLYQIGVIIRGSQSLQVVTIGGYPHPVI